MSNTIVRRTDQGNRIEIAYDLSQAASPIRWRMVGDDDWQSTPYQTADAGHDKAEAIRLALCYLRGVPA